MDFKKNEQKWQRAWEKAGTFKVDVQDYKKEKYYIAIVYPYMNGLLHLGHLFTYTFSEVMARYQRMQGKNVLVKFGFHCTGTPIVSAAKRVKEKEQKQIAILKQMGIPAKEIPKFAKPEYWVDYFPKQTLKDLKALGIAIDERYTFRTTSLNPPYDAFIRWQFNRLKDKGYVKKGKHPVVWCPKDNTPVGDHARSEGEGETPQEFCLFKFKLPDGRYVITATLRPDTVWGITNVYVNPEVTYAEITVGKEHWIVGEPVIEKLKNQEFDLHLKGKVKGKALVGQQVESFGGKNILILPATFLDPEYGTGMVHSVPSDSADDLIALQDLQKNDKLMAKYGLEAEAVKAIKPIEIFETPEIGGNSAQYFLDKYNVKTQHEREKLEKIKKELYKLTFAKSTLGSKYKKGFSKSLAGMLVSKAQNIIKEELVKQGKVALYYELTGKVVCRCLTQCIVKIVKDQWFLEYNDPKWKKITHECLDQLTLYPDIVRKQFEYVLDWLHRWACAREFGLGTRLPWDEKWVIESLSDSTIQMAYATISKYLEHPKDYGFSVGKLNDAFFDYVLSHKGDVKSVEQSTGISKKMIEQMRKDFEYWYPFDFRNSAKDLLQNHLAFCLFNHTALFPRKQWPRSYTLNGRIMVDNQKMSKSKGNFFTARQLYQKYGADVLRLTSANAGEGVDDANFDMLFLDTAAKKLGELHHFVNENYNKGRTNKLPVDDWFASVLHTSMRDTQKHMDNVRFKSALLTGFFDLHRHLKWYTRRTDGKYNKALINKYIETQIKHLAPFTPHICEEMWAFIGGKGFVANAPWPTFDKKKIDSDFELAESLISQVKIDVNQVEKLAQIEASYSELYTPPLWKYTLMDSLRKVLQKTRDFKEILNKVMTKELKQHGKMITKIIPRYIKLGSVPETLSRKEEEKVLEAAKEFFGAGTVVERAENSTEPKAQQASYAWQTGHSYKENS